MSEPSFQKEPGPYILVTDDSGHWYVIPEARREHWDINRDNDFTGEEGAGEYPDYAEAVGGNPNLVQFNDYIIE
jgi:hypothetical protein